MLINKQILKKNHLTFYVAIFIVFLPKTLVAQTFLCTTEDGVSFLTATPDRYSLSVVQCQALPTSEAIGDTPLSNLHDSDSFKTSPNTEQKGYSDQMRLYDGTPDVILSPVVRRQSKKPKFNVKKYSPDASSALVAASVNEQLPYSDVMMTIGQQYKIDPLFLQAIAKAESGHNMMAISPVGARGLMQLMPSTARQYKRFSHVSDLHDPLTNVSIGAAHLKSLQSRYGNDLTLILAAYNAGEGAVAKYGNNVPPFRETKQYVVKVLKNYDNLRNNANRSGSLR
jgi:Transglycosylase SLT domain